MGFEKGKRTGKNWEDILFIDSLIKNSDKKTSGSIMNITGKERKFLNFVFHLFLMPIKLNLTGI